MAREQVTEIVAEMVANVIGVAVAVGDEVAAGDTVVLGTADDSDEARATLDALEEFLTAPA